MRSLRTRLVLGILVGITLFLAGNGILIYASVRNRMMREMDRTLETIARSASANVAMELGRRARGAFPPDPNSAPPFPDPLRRSDVRFQAWREDGVALVRSPELGEASLPRIAGGEEDVVAFESITLPDGSPARAAGLRFRPPPPPRRAPGEPPGDPRMPRARGPEEPPILEIVVARDVRELLSALAHLRWLLVLTWVSSVAGCAAILSWVVHRGLRPLESLRRQIEAVDEATFGRAFAVEHTPVEIEPVIEQLNDLVRRIREAFDREQAFAADAAHELRTPLAGLRSTLEVALVRPRPTEEHLEAERQCLEIVTGMQAMVESLLDLARLGSTPSVDPAEPFRLADLIDECWGPLAPRAAGRGLQWVRRDDRSLAVRADRHLLGRVLGNILDNAVAYAEEGTAVELAASAVDGKLVLAVANSARGAPADVAEKAFDALWRGDASRSETGRHAGLGLSICRKIVKSLGGALEATFREGRFTMTLRGLPAQSG